MFLRQLEDEVFLYCEEHHDADMDALIDRFGPPEELAGDFLPEVNVSVVNEFMKTKRRILILICAVVITVSLLVLGAEIYTCFKRHQILDGYYIESITYEGDITPYITGPTYYVEHFSSSGGNGIPEK